jgi:uncharacterized membrane protein YidH (DUF202 family)
VAKTNPLEGAQDIQRLLIDYAKQETIDPLKTLKRYLTSGLLGSILMFLGVTFLGMGTLRLLQTLEVFEGNSWASLGPYGITIVVFLLAIGILMFSMMRAKRKVLS